MVTMIGIDPHKAIHTAVAIDESEIVLGEVTVRANRSQLTTLLDWADRVHGDGRTWAVEGACGLGYLLSQQLVASGERVVDVPPVLASRVQVLGSGRSDKNDPNDALSVAVAALRQPKLAEVRREDHGQILRMLAKRHLELTGLRTQAVCRLHAVLTLLRPGGMTRRLSADKASRMLQGMRSLDVIGEHRKSMARSHLADIRGLDRDLKANKKRIRTAVAASETTVTEVYGVGPIVAAFLVGYSGDITRFDSAAHYASYNGTAPIEMSSGSTKHRLSLRGNRKLNHAIHMAAVTQVSHPDTPGRVYYDKKRAEGKTKKEALRALKRRVSDAVYNQLAADQILGPGDTQERLCRLRGRLRILITGSSAQSSRAPPKPTPTAATTAVLRRALNNPLDTKRLRSARVSDACVIAR
ncbi:MAG TPA: IS110 family transposase [Acidimicrobiia bacterium]|nr:IS110 family transposase [Acidimicrobiia bacterium]